MFETRIFIKMIMITDHADEDNMEYHIYPRDIINHFQLHSDKSAYRYIRDAADSLRNRSITFPETSTTDFVATAAKRRNSGYRAERSNAENMENPTFRATFKAIVQKWYPEEFGGVKELKKELSKVRGD